MEPAVIREDLKRKHSEIWQDFDSVTPSELLHYASPDAFKGIITSGQMWCTDIGYVKDSREGDHGLEIIRSVVLRKSVPRGFVEAVQRSHDLFGLKRLWTWYISCFSAGGEQAHMWADYAAGGRGCAVAFDYRMLFAGTDEGRLYALFPMLYNRQSQIRKAEQIVDHAIQLQRRLNFTARELDQFWAQEVAFALMNCGTRFKTPCWCREQEFRIAVAGGDDVTPFTATDGRSRLAVPLNRSSVVRVIRGPAAGEDLSVERIRALVSRAGYREDLPIVDAVEV
jgi:hypothetical protein